MDYVLGVTDGNFNKIYHTVRTFPKSNRKIVERGKIDTPNTQIHDSLLFWLGTGT
jgi:hypothetical protein